MQRFSYYSPSVFKNFCCNGRMEFFFFPFLSFFFLSSFGGLSMSPLSRNDAMPIWKYNAWCPFFFPLDFQVFPRFLTQDPLHCPFFLPPVENLFLFSKDFPSVNWRSSPFNPLAKSFFFPFWFGYPYGVARTHSRFEFPFRKVEIILFTLVRASVPGLRMVLSWFPPSPLPSAFFWR